MTNEAIKWVKFQQALTPDKPFMIYYAPGAVHAPHHAPKEWIDKYNGQFDLFINGEWTKPNSGQYFDTINPSNKVTMATIAEADEEDVNQDKTIASYLQSIALITDFDSDEENNDFVTLMSAHAAKGLEFTSVFVVGLEENLFPSFMSISDPKQIDEEAQKLKNLM